MFLTLEAVVFWQLGSLAKTDALRLRPVLATFLIGYVGAAVVSYRYFFVGASDYGDIDCGMPGSGDRELRAGGVARADGIEEQGRG